MLALAQGGERDQFADVGATTESLTDFCVEHVLELVRWDEEAHGVCVWLGVEQVDLLHVRIIAQRGGSSP